MYNEAKKASNNRYLSQFKTISVRMKHAEAEELESKAAEAGESLAGYILAACRERMTGKHDSMPHDSEVTTCGGADGVELEPEAIQAAQAAADQTGETVTEYITRAINDTAKRDEQLRAIGFQQQFLKHKTAE